MSLDGIFFTASVSDRWLTRKPTLPELLNFTTSSGSTVNIVQWIGTCYSTLGPLLLNDDNGSITSSITSQYQQNADAINQEILTRWLQGRGKQPVTWSTLIDVLSNSGLLELANMIKMRTNLVTHMKDQIQALEKEIAELKQQLDMKDITIRQLQDMKDMKDTTIRQLQDMKDMKDNTIRQLQEQETRAQQQLRQQVIIIMCMR